jgi:D-alanine-D-alanine ligase
MFTRNDHRPKIGVLRGGPSAEYEVSLNSGGEVLKHLPDKYHGVDILISKEGEWHLSGFPVKPEKIFRYIDVAFNAMHGEFGEDGKVQQIFEQHNARYTGSTPVASVLAMQKHRAKEIFARLGLKTPRSLVFSQDDLMFEYPEGIAKKIIGLMPSPWVVKPASRGSSVGTSVCFGYGALTEGIIKAFEFDDKILVEEFIKGREATCGVIENYRKHLIYPLPPVEIVPPEGNFFDYTVKYNGATKEICPSGFDNSVKRLIENMAVAAHRALSLRHYSRSDFIVSSRGIYILETNTLPGLTSESLFPKAARAAGMEFPQLLDHLIKLALNR